MTMKPPTTFTMAMTMAVIPRISDNPESTWAETTRAPTMAMPEMAFAPDMSGV